jgi:hypothetical protein
MQNALNLFRHIREQVAMLLGLIADAMRYLELCLRPSPASRGKLVSA